MPSILRVKRKRDQPALQEVLLPVKRTHTEKLQNAMASMSFSEEKKAQPPPRTKRRYRLISSTPTESVQPNQLTPQDVSGIHEALLIKKRQKNSELQEKVQPTSASINVFGMLHVNRAKAPDQRQSARQRAQEQAVAREKEAALIRERLYMDMLENLPPDPPRTIIRKKKNRKQTGKLPGVTIAEEKVEVSIPDTPTPDIPVSDRVDSLYVYDMYVVDNDEDTDIETGSDSQQFAVRDLDYEDLLHMGGTSDEEDDCYSEDSNGREIDYPDDPEERSDNEEYQSDWAEIRAGMGTTRLSSDDSDDIYDNHRRNNISRYSDDLLDYLN